MFFLDGGIHLGVRFRPRTRRIHTRLKSIYFIAGVLESRLKFLLGDGGIHLPRDQRINTPLQGGGAYFCRSFLLGQRLLGFLGVGEILLLREVPGHPHWRTKQATTHRAFDERFFVLLDVLGREQVFGATGQLLGIHANRLLSGFSQTFSPCGFDRLFADGFPCDRSGPGLLGKLFNKLHLAVATKRIQHLGRQHGVQRGAQTARQCGDPRLKVASLSVDAFKNLRRVLCV